MCIYTYMPCSPDPVIAAIATECACLNVRRTARAVTQLYDRTFAPLGLRATQVTLLVALERAGPVPFSRLAEALGFQTTRDEHLVEALARAGRDTHPRLAELIALTDDGVRLAPSFADEVRAAATASDAAIKDVAASVQRRLGECLAALLQRLAVKPAPGALCLSGGLFFNTYFTTVAGDFPLARIYGAFFARFFA